MHFSFRSFQFIGPFPKKKASYWPLKEVFRGYFGPQVKSSGWNTAQLQLYGFIIKKRQGEILFISSNFNKHDRTQLLGKF